MPDNLILPVNDGLTNLNEPHEEPVEKITLDNVEYTLDKEGNAVDDKGTVVKTKADIEAAKDAKTDDDNEGGDDQEIEIDGEVYKLDDKGNAIKDDGSIFMSKEDIDKFDDGAENELDTITKLTGIIPSDEKGNAIVYDNTPQGIANYVSDAIQVRLNEEREQVQRSFFDENPDVYDAYIYKLRNGSLEGFNGKVNWSEIKIEEADDTVLENIIITDLRRKGHTEEKARRLVGLFKADGKLKDEAKDAQVALVTADKQDEEEALRIKAENDKREADETNAYWNEFSSVINSGVIKVDDKQYILPKVFRVKDAQGKVRNLTSEDFVEYVSKPIDVTVEGVPYKLTGYQIDQYNESTRRSVSHDVLDALKLFVKYDMTQFIEEQVKQQNRRRIITSVEDKRGSRQVQTKEKSENLKLQVK